MDESGIGDEELHAGVSSGGFACLRCGKEGIHEEVLVDSAVPKHPIVGVVVAGKRGILRAATELRGVLEGLFSRRDVDAPDFGQVFRCESLGTVGSGGTRHVVIEIE